MKQSSIILFLVFLCNAIVAQENSYAQWNQIELRLDNGVVQRSIQLPHKQSDFLTRIYKLQSGEFNYFAKESPDFQFEINDNIYNGNSKWILLEVNSLRDSEKGNGATVKLLSEDKKVELSISYILYPCLPVIRKKLSIKNLSEKEICLESIDVEKLNLQTYQAPVSSWIYSDYGRRKSIGPYEGNNQDALVIIHNPDQESGIVIGNESPGVLKRTAIFWEDTNFTTGLTHKTSRYPFRKWLKPQESFTTPFVFTMIYNNCKDPNLILNTIVPDFVRKYMGIRLSKLREKPLFVYNTWHPFQKDINEKLVMELAKAAAEVGVKEFVIDDGWQDHYGDWNIDKTKFPNGLKPVFEYIKSLGMKPGLWVSVGSASADSQIYYKHPEWFVKDQNNKFANLQAPGDFDKIRSACYSTGWKDYIKNKLINLIDENGLEYLKLDFAVVSSPYIFDSKQSGCYATNHEKHKDHPESMYINYERMWDLFDELHTHKSDLFIDCTFETMGGLQLIDYAMLKHAEGNWLSNFIEPDQACDLRIRNIAWWRSPAIPATALVIGNPRMDDKGWDLHLKSLMGSLPIMLGDPRKLSNETKRRYNIYSKWIQEMETKYDIMSFRQDMLCLGEPQEGFWDGFQRMNTEKKHGGIFGIFRHGAKERKRRIFLDFLAPDKEYQIINMKGEKIAHDTGHNLSQKGIIIRLDKQYDGDVFEVSEKR